MTLGDLLDHRMLAFMDDPARQLVTQDGEATGSFPPSGAQRRVICDDGTSMKLATVAGAGISMNSHWSIYQEIRGGTLLRVLPDHEIADQSAVWLVYPRSNVLTAKVRAFIDFLLEKIGDPPVWER